MTQQRTAPTPIEWGQTPATWIALALSFVAISLPQWIAGFTDGTTPAFVAAGGFTVAALSFALQAVRLDRARKG